MAGPEAVADQRAALVRWLVEQTGDATLVLAWSDDAEGRAISAGGDPADMSGTWVAHVWADADDASAGRDPEFEVTVAVSGASNETTTFTAAAADILTLGPGTFWWAAKKDGATMVKGPFQIDAGAVFP